LSRVLAARIMGSAASIRAAPLGRFHCLPEALLEHLLCMLDGATLLKLCRCCRGLRGTDTSAVWEVLLRRELGIWPVGRTLTCGGSAREAYARLYGRDTEVFGAELNSRRVKQSPAVAAEPWLWTLGVRLELRNPYPCATWFLFGASPASGASLWSGSASGDGERPTLTLSLASAMRCKGYTRPRPEGLVLPGAGGEHGPGDIVLMSVRLRGASLREAEQEAGLEAWGLLLPPCLEQPAEIEARSGLEQPAEGARGRGAAAGGALAEGGAGAGSGGRGGCGGSGSGGRGGGGGSGGSGSGGSGGSGSGGGGSGGGDTVARPEGRRKATERRQAAQRRESDARLRVGARLEARLDDHVEAELAFAICADHSPLADGASDLRTPRGAPFSWDAAATSPSRTGSRYATSCRRRSSARCKAARGTRPAPRCCRGARPTARRCTF